MTKKIMRIVGLTAFILIMVGCADKTTQPTPRQGTSTFPLSVGTRWQYADTLFRTPYIDSIAPDTVLSRFVRQVIGIDTVENLGAMTVIDDSIIYDDTLYGYSGARRYLKIDDDKLKEYASRLIGDSLGPIIIYENPNILLDFPLNAGKSWTVRQDMITYYSSRVVGAEVRYVNNRSFACDVVFSQLRTNGDADTVSRTLDWYTNDGLIRNEIDFGKVYRFDDNNSPADSAHEIKHSMLVSIVIDTTSTK